MSKRVLWIFVLDNRRTVQNSQRPPPQMPRQTPQGTIDNVTQQLQGMQLYQFSDELHQQSKGKTIQENLNLGQYSDQGAVMNHQKLNQELNNLEQAYKDLKEKLDTARALFTYQVMLPGSVVTMDMLQGDTKRSRYHLKVEYVGCINSPPKQHSTGI